AAHRERRGLPGRTLAGLLSRPAGPGRLSHAALSPQHAPACGPSSGATSAPTTTTALPQREACSMITNDVVAVAALLVSIRINCAGTAPTRPMPPTADVASRPGPWV